MVAQSLDVRGRNHLEVPIARSSRLVRLRSPKVPRNQTIVTPRLDNRGVPTARRSVTRLRLKLADVPT